MEAPHQSENDPGPGWINFKSRITCDVPPPEEMTIEMTGRKHRWWGWDIIAENAGGCPSGTYTHEPPVCEPTRIRLYRSYECAEGDQFNYKNEAIGRLIAPEGTYGAIGSEESDGPITCLPKS